MGRRAIGSGVQPEVNAVGSPCHRWSAPRFNPLILLAAEASGVITLRMMKLMLGGRSARREANLMVSEKLRLPSKLPQV
jgi:hypothetical protein